MKLQPAKSEDNDAKMGVEEGEVLKAKADCPDKEHPLLEAFHGVLTGEFAEDLQKIAESTQCEHKKVLESIEKDRSSNFGQAVSKACDAFDRKAVETAEAAAPTMSVRALARWSSDPDSAEADRLSRAKKERADVWAKAVAIRKQHWRILQWRSPKVAQDYKAQILADRAGNPAKVQLELNERHRAVILSADLSGEPTAPAWGNGPLDSKAYAKFKTLCCVAADLERDASFHFFFDGKNRENRKVIEDAVAKVSPTETAELWVSYEKALQTGVFV